MPLTLRKFSHIFKKHYLAFVFACLVGILCVGPTLYFKFTTFSYAGIEMIGADAEDHYVARIQEIYDGHSGLGNVFIPDKNQPYTIPGLGEITVASFGKILGVSAVAVNILSKFMFPFLVALLLYAFGYTLFTSRAAALLTAVFVMLSGNLLSGPSPWFALLRGTSDAVGFLSYARPINPEISSLFLFGGLLLFYYAFYRKENPTLWQATLVGILAGASLYVSPFVATFLCGVIGVSCLWFLYNRQHKAILYTFVAGGATILTIIPFINNYLRLKSSPWYTEFAMREGLAYGHQFIVSSWLIILFIMVLFLWPKRFSMARPLFASAVVTLWLLTEQQVFTGISIQPSHYHWYLTLPLVGILAAMYMTFIAESLLKKEWQRILLYAFCIGVIIYNGILVQTHSYAARYNASVVAQSYAPIIDYLNTLPPQVVWANYDISMYIPMYTKSDAPYSPQTSNYLIPTSYIHKRFFLSYRLRSITPQNALATMQKERVEVSSAIYAMYWRQQAGSFAAIPDSVLVSLSDEYTHSYTEPLKELLADLGITMIVWDRATNPEWHIDALPFVQKVYSFDTLEMYHIIR